MEDRREFIKKAASITAFGLIANWAAAMPTSDKLGEVLPLRQLTRDGQKVTSFCLGGYHLGFTENPKEAEKMIERANMPYSWAACLEVL